ncbi:hypothetical protein [Fimbriimonas ginsengisoli]|uniref:Lipoprotein n=1 Tax=Fimbriimonas ginsengisoli Gsoil 348 TaxID=661478 RepID=A0A068NVI6_FIMGI|nr:hypothetical protein [Fimbriimonas ginsengisoli]AIE87392.1 hypothetical protein OP10G_4024 [Fimbriimonas ginsengisoli Gsoil 348]
MKKGLLSILALGALAVSGQAQVTRVRGGYMLRVKYTKGQSIHLDSSNTAGGLGKEMAGGKLQFKMPITMNVLNVKDGYALVQIKLGQVKSGNRIVNPGQTAVVRLDDRNQPKDSETPTNLGATLPKKPVKVGQTWSGSVPVSTGMGGGKLNATYRFAGLKMVGGKSVAVLTYTLSGFATGTGRITLLASDGTLNSNEMKLSIKGLGANPITVTSLMTRG